MKRVYSVLYQQSLIYAFLCAVFVPFSFQLWDLQSNLSHFLFEDLAQTLAPVFSINILNTEFSSDSSSLYILVLLLLFPALVFNLILENWKRLQQYKEQLLKFIQIALCLYLSLIMFRYGLDKLFRLQFYLPEPNTLFTPLGMLDKDILFWSTMGVSHSYNVFMGLSELLCASLILFRPTRNLALLLLFPILINIVAINFSFDISVKLFSLILLFINLLLLIPNLRALFAFLLKNEPKSMQVIAGPKFQSGKWLKLGVQSLIAILFFMELFLPKLQAGLLTEEQIKKPFLQGAYQVNNIKSLSQNQDLDLQIKRFFVHGQGYFIFQYEDDSMSDFKLKINQERKILQLLDYDSKVYEIDYQYNAEEGLLKLNFPKMDWQIQAQEIDWEKLPLLQSLFHWSVDEAANSAKELE